MLIDGEPKMTAVHVLNPSGIDPDYMQIFFRWRTPLDVVQRLVPELGSTPDWLKKAIALV